MLLFYLSAAVAFGVAVLVIVSIVVAGIVVALCCFFVVAGFLLPCTTDAFFCCCLPLTYTIIAVDKIECLVQITSHGNSHQQIPLQQQCKMRC